MRRLEAQARILRRALRRALRRSLGVRRLHGRWHVGLRRLARLRVARLRRGSRRGRPDRGHRGQRVERGHRQGERLGRVLHAPVLAPHVLKEREGLADEAERCLHRALAVDLVARALGLEELSDRLGEVLRHGEHVLRDVRIVLQRGQ